MSRRRAQAAASITIIALALLSLLGGALALPLHVGAMVISPSAATWSTQQAIYRTGKFDAVRWPVHAAEFGTSPAALANLIDDGATSIILDTASCQNLTVASATNDLTPYQSLIQAHPTLDWWIELDNEPNLCGNWNAANEHRLIGQLTNALTTYHQWGVRIAASMPTQQPLAAAEWGSGLPVDGVAVHAYSFTNLLTDDGNPPGWWPLLSWAEGLGKPVLITEAGIDDPNTPEATKATRELAWLKTLPNHVDAVTFFALNGGAFGYHQYTVDTTEAQILAGWASTDAPAACQSFAATGQAVCNGFLAFFTANGGVPIFGYPITGEFTENGLTVQYFQRARFEWHPGSDPSEWDTELGLVGQELWDLKGRPS